MLPDFTDIFQDYERLAAETEALFQRVSDQHPGCAACHAGCDDCCSALFDLSLVEAMHLNKKFLEKFPSGQMRSRILERASDSDRKLTREKRELYLAEKKGDSPAVIMERASTMRSTCPLLEDSRCVLYEERPITCRLYGIPLAIGGKSHVCGFSAFDKGKSYPAVQMDKIQQRLEELSQRIAKKAESRFDLHDVYVPLSMALLTKYDDKYLGIGKEKDD